MAVRAKRSRTTRPYGTIFVLLLLAVALGWILVPMSQGKPVAEPLAFVNQWFGTEARAAEPSNNEDKGPPPGKVRVLVSGRPIAAYAKVTRDDLWNAASGYWAHADVDKSLVEEGGVLVDVKDIAGRIMAHEKRPGYAFTESDFLPEGTRPGLAGGVPAGKRALRLDVEKVHGIVGLQPGDRFDMVAAQALEQGGPNTTAQSFAGVYSEQMRRKTELGTYRRAKVQVLVQNGVVVSPLQTRAVPVTSTTLTSGQTTRTIPVQEMIIALDPEEVAPFLEALSVEADITCLARSGRPDDPLDSMTPSSDPTNHWWNWSPGFGAVPGTQDGGSGDDFTIIESIVDGERKLVPVPRRGAAPQTDPEE